jgi:hypothetical protein
MDQQYIKEQRIVDRYLAGDLTVKEARAFEKYCLAHPEVLQEMPIPVRLKARLSRQPLETSETGMFQTIPSSTTIAATESIDADDEDEDEIDEPPRRTVRMVGDGGKGLSYALLAGIALLAASTVYYGLRARAVSEDLQQLKQSVNRHQLQAPSGVQTYKLALNRTGVPSSPTIALGWLDPAQLLELNIDTTQLPYSQYQVTIQKRDDARLLVLRRVARDSNRELRLALNSTAFGPGEYILRIEGYTWRGQLEPAGWVAIGLE